MDDKSTGKNIERDAKAYLDRASEGYILDPTSGLHKPKGHTEAKKSEDSRDCEINVHPNITINPSIVIDAPRKRFEFVKAIPAFLKYMLSVSTVVLLFLTVKFTYLQWKEAQKSATAAQWSSYEACRSSQISRASLSELQSELTDTHASAGAGIEQARASMTTERAIVTFHAKFPRPGEFFNNQVGMPFYMKNEGKSDSFNLILKAEAVLVKDTEVLKLNKVVPTQAKSVIFRAGAEIPELSNDTRFRSVTSEIVLHDLDGKVVPATSAEGIKFTNNNPNPVYIYGSITYSDAFGIYESRFCHAMYVLQVADMRGPTENETICGKYSYEKSKYTTLPMALPPLTKKTEFAPIECVKPSS